MHIEWKIVLNYQTEQWPAILQNYDSFGMRAKWLWHLNEKKNKGS